MTSQTPIACDLHDHLEVACLYRYDLEVHLRDGTQVSGQAVTTRTDADKTEYLVLETAAGRYEVAMPDLARIDVTTPSARFTTLEF